MIIDNSANYGTTAQDNLYYLLFLNFDRDIYKTIFDMMIFIFITRTLLKQILILILIILFDI